MVYKDTILWVIFHFFSLSAMLEQLAAIPAVNGSVEQTDVFTFFNEVSYPLDSRLEPRSTQNFQAGRNGPSVSGV